MRTFLTISLVASLAVMLAGSIALAILLPWWAVPLIGGGMTPAMIATVEAIKAVRQTWEADECELVDVTDR